MLRSINIQPKKYHIFLEPPLIGAFFHEVHISFSADIHDKRMRPICGNKIQFLPVTRLWKSDWARNLPDFFEFSD